MLSMQAGTYGSGWVHISSTAMETNGYQWVEPRVVEWIAGEIYKLQRDGLVTVRPFWAPIVGWAAEVRNA